MHFKIADRHQEKGDYMTHRALRLYMILAVSLVVAGITTQSFAHHILYGVPEVSYQSYGLGVGWGIVGWLAINRWQEFRFWNTAPVWVGTLLAAVGSVLLSRAVTNDEGAPSGLMGLLPIFCFGALIANRLEVRLTELSEPLTLAILCAWGIIMPFPATLVGLAFLAMTSWRSPLRRSVVNANLLVVSGTAIAIAISPYRRDLFLRWVGYGELPWEFLRERVLANLNPTSGTHVVLPFANDEFLLTSFIEWQGYWPGVLVGVTAVGLLAWAIIEFSKTKAGGWQQTLGLALAACLLPITTVSLLSNFGIALAHIHGLPFFAPDIVYLIYATMLVGALYTTRSVSCHQPQLD